jgi:hypothetical protein
MDSKQINKKLIDKYINSIITPFLLENEFKKVGNRKYLKISDYYYFGIEIGSWGYYHNSVIGWPTQTLFSNGAIMCRFIPDSSTVAGFTNTLTSNDTDFFPIADGKQHKIFENICGLDQKKYFRKKIEIISKLYEPNKRKEGKMDKVNFEQECEIYWWIDDNSNLEIIINDIKDSIYINSINYFKRFNTMEDFITVIENQHDCIIKYFNAYHLYNSLKMKNEAKLYKDKLIEEAKRIGRDIRI